MMKQNSNRFAKSQKGRQITSDFMLALRIILFFAIIIGLIFVGVNYFRTKFAPKPQTETQTTTETKTEIPLPQESPPNPISKEELTQNLNTYLSTLAPTYGISLISSDESFRLGINNSQQFVAASTVKVPVAIYVLNQIEKGIINPSSTITYTKTDYEGGTGIIQGNAMGTKYSVTKLLDLMISKSDNVALNMLLRTYGRANMQSYLNTLGYTGIDLMTNHVTPESMSQLLVDLNNNKLLAAESKNSLLSYMENSIVPDRINNGVPTEVAVYHKIGTNVGSISDIAIINYTKLPYILSVYSQNAADEYQTNQEIKNISSMIYAFIAQNY